MHSPTLHKQRFFLMRIPFFATLILFCLALASATQAATLAYWRFEEGTPGGAVSGPGSVIDSAGGFHGSPVGGPTYSGDVPINPVPLTAASNGVSLDLQNGSDYVTIPDPTSALIPTAAITVEVWMKSGGTQPEFQSLVVDHSHGWTDETGWALQGNGGNTRIDFIIGNGSTFPLARSTTNVFDGQWHHVAGVYNLANVGQEIKIFVDGQLEDTATTATALAANTRDVHIGSSWHGTLPTNRFFHGLVDEVRISDVALAPQQFLVMVPEPSAALLTIVGFAGLG